MKTSRKGREFDFCTNTGHIPPVLGKSCPMGNKTGGDMRPRFFFHFFSNMDAFRQEFESLFTLERLHRAHSKAAKGKRFRPETARFGTRLFENLQRIRETVLAGTYAF